MTNYVELHTHSYFSLLDGASAPIDLVKRATQIEMNAIALTDHDGVYGAVEFVGAAKKQGIKPILGAELTLAGGYHLTLLVANKTGWQNLCYVITQARHNAPKGEAELPYDELVGHTDGLIALSGCRRGEVAQTLLAKNYDHALAVAQRYRRLFGQGCFWMELQHHLLPEDTRLNALLVELSEVIGVGYVATNNVHYAKRDAHRLQDTLVSIRHNTALDEAMHLHRPNSEYYLKAGREMIAQFAHYPHALSNTLLIADICSFELEYGLQDLPQFPTPDGIRAEEYLRFLCENGLVERSKVGEKRVQKQLAYELDVIGRSGLANYFLIVWDIIRFARQSGIRCQGRGSAANSLVAYLLGISPIDPLAHELVFERFLSDERTLTPDIDIDFDAARREEVIQYVYDRYGRDHAGMACTFVTFRQKSSVRDIGKMLSLPQDTLDRISALSVAGDWEWERLLPQSTSKDIGELTESIAGFPRHLGIHNGGIVITNTPLFHRVPTEPATMEDRTVVQWDKDALENVGLVKIDLLGLRMLSAIADAVELVELETGTKLELDRLTFDDPAIYEMISSGDTIGVFQVESRAQSQMLPRFKPRKFTDLIIAISLIRPGPIMGDMVHPYLRRRLGEEPVTYFHDRLIPALKETLGVILFQEQVLKVARDLSGFTAGEGELLRRALGSKHAPDAIESFHTAFVDGAIQNDVDRETAELVFNKLRAFGSYSFPKSHAASFAVLVYQSAFLKCYYPTAFFVGLLRNQPMGFYSPAVVVNDAKRHKIAVLPVDVNQSPEQCCVTNGAIRLGLDYVKGFGQATCERVIATRQDREFASLADFCKRTRLPQRLVENLILSGGFDFTGLERRKLLWDVGLVSYTADELDLVYEHEPLDLPEAPYLEELGAEFHQLGISLHEHPVELYRDWLTELGILGSKDLPHFPSGSKVTVAGLNVVHQSPPTAKGFHFITLEDEHGFINVIFRPRTYTRYKAVIHGEAYLIVEGTIEREGDVINILATSAKAMP